MYEGIKVLNGLNEVNLENLPKQNGELILTGLESLQIYVNNGAKYVPAQLEVLENGSDVKIALEDENANEVILVLKGLNDILLANNNEIPVFEVFEGLAQLVSLTTVEDLDAAAAGGESAASSQTEDFGNGNPPSIGNNLGQSGGNLDGFARVGIADGEEVDQNAQPVVFDVTLGQLEVLGEHEAGDKNIIAGQFLVEDADAADTGLHEFTVVEGSVVITSSSGVITQEDDEIEIILNADGTYEVSGDFNDLAFGETATITFDYIATDPLGFESLPATFTLNITGTNDQSVVEDIDVNNEDLLNETFDLDSNDTNENGILRDEDGNNILSGQLFASDDDDTDSHTFHVQEGSLDIDAPISLDDVNVDIRQDDNDNWIYEIDGDFTNLSEGEKATVTFQYYADDGNIDSNGESNESERATIKLVITGTNDQPHVENIDLGNIDEKSFTNKVFDDINVSSENRENLAFFEDAVFTVSLESDFSLKKLSKVQDNDLNDTHTFALASDSNIKVNGESKTAISSIDVNGNENSFTISGGDIFIIVNEDGSYSIEGPMYNSLGEGESLKISFDYVAIDSSEGLAESNTSEAKTLSLTILGTNDQPVINDVSIDFDNVEHTFTDLEGENKEVYQNGKLEGKLNFSVSDEDINDGHEFVSFEKVNATIISETYNNDRSDSPKDVISEDILVKLNADGTFEITNKNFDNLGFGEKVEISFKVQVTDGTPIIHEGNLSDSIQTENSEGTLSNDSSVSEEYTVSMTIYGSNDKPTISPIFMGIDTLIYENSDIDENDTSTPLDGVLRNDEDVNSIKGKFIANDDDFNDAHTFEVLSMDNGNETVEVYDNGNNSESQIQIEVSSSNIDSSLIDIQKILLTNNNADGETQDSETNFELLGDFTALASGEKATVKFLYQANDNQNDTNGEASLSEPQFVEIVVSGTNDQPVIENVSFGQFISKLDRFTNDGSDATYYNNYSNSYSDIDNSAKITNDRVHKISNTEAMLTLETINGRGDWDGAKIFLFEGEVLTLTSMSGDVDYYLALDDDDHSNGTPDPVTGAFKWDVLSLSTGQGESISMTAQKDAWYYIGTGGSTDSPSIYYNTKITINSQDLIFETNDKEDLVNIEDTKDETINTFIATLEAKDQDINDNHTFFFDSFDTNSQNATANINGVNVLVEGSDTVNLNIIANNLSSLEFLDNDSKDSKTDFKLEGDFTSLSAGETATITFKYYVEDTSVNQINGEINKSEVKEASITITGTNDQPVVLDKSYMYSETFDNDKTDSNNDSILRNDEPNNILRGTLLVNDEDISDTHTFDLESMSQNDITRYLDSKDYSYSSTQNVSYGSSAVEVALFSDEFDISQNINLLSLDLINLISSDTSTQSTMDFSLEGNFTNLAAGEKATIVFRYTASDNSSNENDVLGVNEKNISEDGFVTLTIMGTNDQPVIDYIHAFGSSENEITKGIFAMPGTTGINEISLSEISYGNNTNIKVDEIVPSFAEGSAAKYVINTFAGEELSFDWNFDARDDSYVGDNAFIIIDGSVQLLSNAVDASGKLIHTFDSAGDHTIIIGVINNQENQDFIGSSLLTIENPIGGVIVDVDYIGNINIDTKNTSDVRDDIVTLSANSNSSIEDFTEFINPEIEVYENAVLEGYLAAKVSDDDLSDTHEFVDFEDKLVSQLNGTISESHDDSTYIDLITTPVRVSLVDGKYTITSTSFDKLGEGDSVTVSFEVQVIDNSKGSEEENKSEAKLVSLTINGTNDQPIIETLQYTDSFFEKDNLLSDSDEHSILKGDINFTVLDEDVNDNHEFVAQDFISVNINGQSSSVTASITKDGNYEIKNTAFNNLSAGEEMIISFDVQIKDDSKNPNIDGNETNISDSKTVVLKVIGTNDQPVVNPVTIDEVKEDLSKDGLNTIQGEFTSLNIDEDTIDTHTYNILSIDNNIDIGNELGSDFVRLENIKYDADGNNVYESDIDIAIKLPSKSEFTIENIDIQGIKVDGSSFSLVGNFNALPEDEVLTIKFLYNAEDSSNTNALGNNESNTSDSQWLTINVKGTQDAAEISYHKGHNKGFVLEDSISETNGKLDIKDVDAGELFETQTNVKTKYGIFTISEDGYWNYKLDDSKVQFLSEGQKIKDVIVVNSEDGQDSQKIKIKIIGNNDTPILEKNWDFDSGLSQDLLIIGGSTEHEVYQGTTWSSGSDKVLNFFSNGERSITIENQDTTNGGKLVFDFIYGNDKNGGEDADVIGEEEVVFEYSLDNGNTWISFKTFDFATYQNAIWNNIEIDLSSLPSSSNIDLRIKQLGNSGANYDHWAINNLDLTPHVTNTQLQEMNTSTDLISSSKFEFIDLDTTDSHEVKSNFETGTYIGVNGTINANYSEIGSLLAVMSNDSTGNNKGEVTWTYKVNDSLIQFLGKDEVIELEYTISVDDKNGGVTSKDIFVTLVGTNDAPKIIANTLNDINVKEMDYGEITGNLASLLRGVNFTDVDTNDKGWEYNTINAGTSVTVSDITSGAASNVGALSISMNSSGTYILSGAGLEKLAFDEKISVSFDVSITDGNDSSTPEKVILTITGTNDKPVVSNILINDISESSSSGLIVGQVTFDDVDVNDTIQYSFIAPSNEFEINSLTGEITVKTGSNFDYESITSYNLTVVASDGNGGNETQDITINIIDENDTAPIANNDKVITNVQTSFTIPSSALLSNDIDADTVGDMKILGGNTSIGASTSTSGGFGINVVTKTENPNDDYDTPLNDFNSNAVIFERSEFGTIFSSSEGEISANVKNSSLPTAKFIGTIDNKNHWSANRDFDVVKVNLIKGEKIILDIDYGSSLSEVDTVISIKGPGQTYTSDENRFNDDALPTLGGNGSIQNHLYGDSQDSYLEYTALDDGDHYIKIKSFSNRDDGNYELYMSIDNTNTEVSIDRDSDYTVSDDVNAPDTAHIDVETTTNTNLVGTEIDEIFIANDSTSSIEAGGGNDNIIFNSNLDSVNGQSGKDTLTFTDLNNEITMSSVLSGAMENADGSQTVIREIEEFDLSNGSHILSNISVKDVIAMASNNSLKIEGDSDDIVNLDPSEWTRNGNTNEYTNHDVNGITDNTIKLLIDEDIQVTI